MENIYIDYRINSRFIGFRGRNTPRIIDKYHVDIRFPKYGRFNNPDLVTDYAREDITHDDILDRTDTIR